MMQLGDGVVYLQVGEPQLGLPVLSVGYIGASPALHRRWWQRAWTWCSRLWRRW